MMELSIFKTMKVVSITKKIADEWVSKKHYSHRPSIFWKGFALVINEMIEGVVVYGQPSPAIQKHAFSERDFRLYELSRLVIQTKQKNAASFLVGNSLKLLEKPCAVVSYADSAHGHCGYVYQATNWLYTGATKSHDHLYEIDGELVQAITIRDRYGVTNPKEWARRNKIKTIPPHPKHRYFYICGNKRDRKPMYQKLRYETLPYPKQAPSRYDDGDYISMRSSNCLLTED